MPAQRLQALQRALDGGERWPGRRRGGRWTQPPGMAPESGAHRRQTQSITFGQGEQQAAGRKRLESPQSRAPFPALTQLVSHPIPAPLRVRVDQLLEFDQFGGRQAASLCANEIMGVHGPQGAGKKTASPAQNAAEELYSTLRQGSSCV